jgi:pyruvate,orthophosphate dikinase
MAEDPSFPLSRADAVQRVRALLGDPPRTSTAHGNRIPPIATGLPASPGVASGPVVITPEAAVEAAERGERAVLVRAETSPDDVHGMAAAVGILTSRGGLASHAAVVARGWGIPAVVGATAVELQPESGMVHIGDRTVQVGEVLTIDGTSGEIFEGTIPDASTVVPEAATLLTWAAGLGIETGGETPEEVEATAETGADEVVVDARRATPDGVLTAIGIKGFALLPAVAESVGATPEVVESIVDQLAIDGLVVASAGAFKLTDAGTARLADLRAAERAAWGEDRAVAALDAFIPIDHEVKAAVTAWQVKDEVAGVFNDHGDADYDAAVLDRLAGVHASASAWLTMAGADRPARFVTYGDRLARALEAARAGDTRYVASPRVDSYHGIWFELHEDLIHLAGRTRAQEVEAGRA